MPQAGGDPALAQEAIPRATFGVITEDHLDGDLVAEERAPGPIHRAHAALGEWREDLVPVVEDVACRQHAYSLDQWQGLGLGAGGIKGWKLEVGPWKLLLAEDTFHLLAKSREKSLDAPADALLDGSLVDGAEAAG